MKSAVKAGRVATWIAGGLLLLYVVYAHVAEAIRVREYRTGTELVRFGVPQDLAGLEVAPDGLEPRLEGGRMRIVRTSDKPGQVTFLGAPRRLDPSQLVRVRFRVKAPPGGARPPVDVAVGFETPGGRRLEIALLDGPGPALFRLHGDRAAVDRTEPISVTLPETDARLHLEDRDGEHELALRLENDPHLIVPMLDGVALPPQGASGWLAGVMVRPWLGVRAREPGAPFDVEILELESRVLPRPIPLPLDFEERFGGKVIDPSRWVVWGTAPGLGETAAVPGPRGLHITGTSQHPRGFLPALHVRGPTFPLDDFELVGDVEVSKLVRSAVLFAISAEWVLPWNFEVGILEPGQGAGEGNTKPMVPFVAGQFDNGQFGFQTFPAPPGWGSQGSPESGRRIRISMRYTRATRVGRYEIDGVLVTEKRLDLLPYEEVRLRFGTNFQEPGARLDVVVRGVSLRR